MKRSVLVGIAAAVTAAAIAGVLSRPYLWPSGETKHAHVMEQARAEPGAAIYYQDPDGKPFYSLTPKKTPDGRDYRAVPAGRRRQFRRSGGCGGCAACGSQDQVLPQSDGPAGRFADAQEGLDGDGLHPRLRRRGQRRRIGQAVAGQDPAYRRQIGTGCAARDPHHDPRPRHHSARRTARLRDRDARRKLCPESRRRHHRRARRQGPAADGNLQSGGLVGRRRIHLDAQFQGHRRRRGALRQGLAAAADESRCAGGGDRRHREGPERSDRDRMDLAA